MKSRFCAGILSVLLFWFSLETKAQTQTVIVQNGTDSSQYYPYYINNNHSVNEMIYLQSQIQKAGFITKIAFFKVKGVDVPIDHVTIYLKTTQLNAFTSGTLDTTGYTRVFSGEIPWSPVTKGWREIILDTSFYYDNTANLQIIFQRKYSNWNAGVTGDLPFYACGFNVGRNASRRVSNLYPIAPTAMLIPEPVLPNIKLEFSNVASVQEYSAFKEINMFPNPARESIFINGLPPESEITVTDITGREISGLPVNARNDALELNVADLKAGVYFIKVHTKQKIFRKRFV